jgi:mono/diheme cytochrome c family protein
MAAEDSHRMTARGGNGRDETPLNARGAGSVQRRGSMTGRIFSRGAMAAALLGVAGGAVGATKPKVDFSREVLPLLSDNCFACHGPDTNKVKGELRLDLPGAALKPAKSGKPAIVAGKPDESELVRRLLTSDEDDRMPPAKSHKTLTAEQKDLFRRWIAEGAQYKGHWAYAPPVRPATPATGSPIDFLVRSRLKELGWSPAPEADRRTLARRVYFDLAGLPPPPGEVAAFEKDGRADAYGRMVEKLLESPHYGERMAIGWLDIVRFADTIGYHSDNPRNIWPYRDYVIRSFNENKRFDQFTREQLAGDFLPDATQEQKVGSAFNRLLLTTEEGGAQPKDYEARYLTDRVRAVGAVWLGATIGCAQCHDHKFDPITTRDFYSMGAFFADIEEPIIGRREDGMLTPDAAQAAVLADLRKRVDATQEDLARPRPDLADAFGHWARGLENVLANEALWTARTPAAVASAGGATLKIRDDRSVLATGANPDKDTYTATFSGRLNGVVGVRVEALPDDSLPSMGPGRNGNGNFVLTEVVGRVMRDGAEVRPVWFRSARASVEQTLYGAGNPYGAWTAASAIDGDIRGSSPGWAVLPEVGRAQQLVLEAGEPVSLGAGETLVLELQQNHGDGGHNLGRFRISTTTSRAALSAPFATPPPGELAAALRTPPADRTAAQRDALWAAYRREGPELEGERRRLAEAREALAKYESGVPRCLVTERNKEPRKVRVLPRGNFLDESGPVMAPALPAFLVKDGGREAGRRLNRMDLANWLVSRENPLTARVIMNRLWRQFFGVGLSKVLDDLGAQGEPPPNQALLDWLACEFMDSGWDIKHMVRLIVTSDTYRQSSVASKEMLEKDPANRALARQGRWRLDAELVRDNALVVSGLACLRVGGPSVRPVQPEGYWENLNFPQRTYEPSVGEDGHRRGIYTWWQRSFVHPDMLAFDAPTREECTAERNRSNIPQQALVLLNDPVYVEAARALALRALREAQGDDAARIGWAWEQVLDRRPTRAETQILRALLEKHLAEYREDRLAADNYLRTAGGLPPHDLDAARLAAWTDVARALLNLHETITRS